MKKQKHEEYEGIRAVGVRLTEELAPGVVGHSSELELPLLYAYHMFDKAHLVMMAEEKIIPPGDAALMLASLREMEKEGIEKVRLEVGGGMHSAEQYLIRKLSEEIGGRINLARSSGDLDKTGDKIQQRDRLLDVMDAINEFRGVLLKVAAKHLDKVMPGYTHMHHAQPTTFGHWLICCASVLERDFKRLEAAFHSLNMSPAGAAILTGSNFPNNRHRTAELLGFEGPIANTIDAVHSPDDLLEVFSAMAILHANIARWADDIIIWTMSEVNMVDLPDRYCMVSSIHPQKKVVVTMEYARGRAAETVGGLMTTFFGEKGPTALAVYSRHFQSTAALRKSFDQVIQDVRDFTGLIAGIKVNKELMRERAGAFWAQATDVASALVRDKGLSWRTAHQIVSILVRITNARGIKPRDVDTTLLDEAAVEYMGKPAGLDEDSLRKALDPVEFVKGRTLYGGPAPEEARKRIPEFTEALKRDKETMVNIRRHLEEASEKLEKAIDNIINTWTPSASR